MDERPGERTEPGLGAVGAAVLAAGVTTLVLDLVWLGLVARRLYDEALGPLRAPEVYWPAAFLFYAFYVAVTVAWAVLGAGAPLDAARRGAGLGLVAYATYELTNWAVLRGWPGWIVPVDVAWGVVLTASAALAGKLAQQSVERARL